MARLKTELGKGARNVAWHDALVEVTGLTNEALDLEYAKYRADGSERDDGGGRGTFWSIGRYAYDPAKVHSDTGTKTTRNMSVYDAVARDPELARINTDVYDQDLWRLLSRPEVGDAELQSIITRTLRRQGLYRPLNVDRTLGKMFLKDKSAYAYASREQIEDAFYKISSWRNIAGLTLLAALSRERLRVGAFAHIGLLQDEFNFCLEAVAHHYGFSKDLQRLIHWLAAFRVFSNRWDDDIPNDRSRAKALAHINSRRNEQGKRPLKKSDFWVEALAVRYHTTRALYKYAPTPLTPQLKWLDENRIGLSNAIDDWDHQRDTDDLWCPLF